MIMFSRIFHRIPLNFAIYLLVYLCSLVHGDNISNKRLCADRNCKTLISKAKALARTKPTDPAFLAFEKEDIINIYSKSAGSRQDLWGGEVNRRKGYFPRSFVREYKVQFPNPQFVLQTEPHVPIEDKMRREQTPKQVKPPGNTQDVKPITIQPDTQATTRQPNSQIVADKSQDTNPVQKIEEDKKKASEVIDETEIGDETELPDNEEEVESKDADSGLQSDIEQASAQGMDGRLSGDVEQGAAHGTDGRLSGDVKQAAAAGIERNKADTQEAYKASDDENATETDETEIADETDLGDEEEVPSDDKLKDEDIEKLVEDISTDIVEDPGRDVDVVEANKIEDVKEETGSKTGEVVRDEAEEIKKEMEIEGNKIDDTGQREKNDETEVVEKGETDESGSMLGSLWTEKDPGKIDREDIDTNKVSQAENVMHNPNPDINIGGPIDNLVRANIDIGDGIVHENRNENVADNVAHLENDAIVHDDEHDNKYTDPVERDTHESETVNDEQSLTDKKYDNKESDNENVKIDTHNDDQDADTVIPKTVGAFGNTIDDSYLHEHLEPDKEDKISTENDIATTEHLQNGLHSSENGLNHVGNSDIDLKDILRSSLTEGEDVHQYLVEHSPSYVQVPDSKVQTSLTDAADNDRILNDPDNINSAGIETPAKPSGETLSVETNSIKENSNNEDREQLSAEKHIRETDQLNGENNIHIGNKGFNIESLAETIESDDIHSSTSANMQTDSAEQHGDEDPSVGLQSAKMDITKDVQFGNEDRDFLQNKTVENSRELLEIGESNTPTINKDDEEHRYAVNVEDSNQQMKVDTNDEDNEFDNSVKQAEQLHSSDNESEGKSQEHSNDNNKFIESEEKGLLQGIDTIDGSLVDDSDSDENVVPVDGITGNKRDSIDDFNDFGTKAGKDSEDLTDDAPLQNIEDKEDQLLDSRDRDMKYSVEQTGDEVQILENETTKTEADRTIEVNQTSDVVDIKEEDSKDGWQAVETEDKSTMVDEDQSSKIDVNGDMKNGAVTSPFQKKTDDNETHKDADQTLSDKPSDVNREENAIDDRSSVNKQETNTLSGDNTAHEIHEKPTVSDNHNTEDKTEDTLNIESTDTDKNAEEVLENFEKDLEAMATGKSEHKDGTPDVTGDGKDELKFINEQGETVQVDEVKDKLDDDQNKGTETTDSNVKEMEIEQTNKENILKEGDEKSESFGTDKNLYGQQANVEEQKLRTFERMASGMMSILATPTLSAEIQASIVDSTESSIPNVDNTETVTGTFSTNTESFIDSTLAESVVEAMQETVSDRGEQMHNSVTDSQLPSGDAHEQFHQEAEPHTNEPIHNDDRGGIVFDGTTFDAAYFGEEENTDSMQATPVIVASAAFMNNVVHTPAGSVKPTTLSPGETSQTLLPPEIQHDVYATRTIEQNTMNTATSVLNNIQASETVKDKPIREDKVSDTVKVFGTSVGFVNQSIEDANTLPIDTVRVAMETIMLQNNETVYSDNVQEQVQPSQDQNSYNADSYMSRKPLSTDPASTGASAESNMQDQDVRIEDQMSDQSQGDSKQVDVNNNDISKTVVDEDSLKNNGDWTVFAEADEPANEPEVLPTTESPDQTGIYGGDEHVYTRKVPDPELEDDVKTSQQFIKHLEQYLKTLISMLPPSMQTLLEQEPLGLTPTLTMLVSLISTIMIALLTCMSCMCKGKKKPSEKKDPLVVIRELEDELFLTTKEKENLEDDLQVKEKNIEEMQHEMNNQQSSTDTVETDLKTIQLHNGALKKQISQLQEELADHKQDVSEKTQMVAYKDLELQNYYMELQSVTQRAQDSELALQTTSQCLGEKDKGLRLSLQQVQSLSEKIQHLETRQQQLEDESVDRSEKVKDLTEQVEQYSSESKRMQEDLAFKENELEVLRDCFLQVKAFQGEDELKEETEESPDLAEKLKQMMDVSRVNASLRSVEEERDVIQNKLVIEVESRKELEDQVQLLKRRFESNQTDKMKAERQCQEAQTKLEVLSKYFREKEAELSRQLGEQEVLKNQNISRLESSDGITLELAKENDIYRQQIEDLKTEITKAERDFRSQIAANEKKAHENWLATRAAERELKESRHECGMLRQKLTDLERKLMQGPPPGLIRPITHRAMPPPGMMNGPRPPPPPERPGSRGSVHGHVTPRLRDDEYRESPLGPDRMPPPPDRRLPPGPMGPRPPPPPLNGMSPPPYGIRPPFPPDRRSPPFNRFPPPRGPRPPYPRPPPPHLRSPPLIGAIPPQHDDSRQGQVVSPYNRGPRGSQDHGPTHHQSQV